MLYIVGQVVLRIAVEKEYWTLTRPSWDGVHAFNRHSNDYNVFGLLCRQFIILNLIQKGSPHPPYLLLHIPQFFSFFDKATYTAVKASKGKFGMFQVSNVSNHSFHKIRATGSAHS